MILQNKFYFHFKNLQKRFYSAMAITALLMCTACYQPPLVKPLSGGIIELTFTQLTGFYNEVDDEAFLKKAALEACPTGYKKIAERLIAGNPIKVIWEIKCLP